MAGLINVRQKRRQTSANSKGDRLAGPRAFLPAIPEVTIWVVLTGSPLKPEMPISTAETGRIVIAWLVTLPVTILVAGGLYYLLESPTIG